MITLHFHTSPEFFYSLVLERFSFECRIACLAAVSFPFQGAKERAWGEEKFRERKGGDERGGEGEGVGRKGIAFSQSQIHFAILPNSLRLRTGRNRAI